MSAWLVFAALLGLTCMLGTVLQNRNERRRIELEAAKSTPDYDRGVADGMCRAADIVGAAATTAPNASIAAQIRIAAKGKLA